MRLKDKSGKQLEKLKNRIPSSKLVLTGCAAQISPSNYKQMKEVDHLVDNINKLKPEAWNNIFDENKEDIFIKDIFDEVNDAAPTSTRRES
jgi:threonylcarbamoyladenosine tRNA methylthiotransferase MtaB